MEILIAEDEITSLKTLEAVLSKWGYDVKTVCDGEAAWEVLSQPKGPKLSIIDWLMPKMDGIEVCRKVKALNPSAYIILLTSVEDPNAISTALLAGADDFVAKPFNRHELEARLEVGKRMVSLYGELSAANNELRRYANDMEILAQEKAKQLIHAERLSSLGMLTAGIAHEINNPTTFISLNVQALQKFWPVQEKWIKNCPKDHPDSEKLKSISKKMLEIIEGIRTGTRRIGSIVNGLKSFSRQDAPQQCDYDLHQVIDAALLLCGNALKYNVTVKKLYLKELPYLKGDAQKIEQVFVNLFSNAADAMAAMKEGSLIIRTNLEQDKVTIEVKDNGPGLSEDALKKIWDPFFTTKPVGKGTGLGMSISHGLIESHGGTITVKNRPESGAEFVVKLPIKR